MKDLPYIGQELDIFACARNWKKYWSSEIRPFLTGDILEVGAGIGANTEFLKSARVSSWTSLEPDSKLLVRMRSNFDARPDLSDCSTIGGTTESLGSNPLFHCILYIDVLEHIQNDKEELGRASMLLNSGGKIVVLAPAHQELYTPFDRAIGHFRRYNKASLAACTPSGCKIERLVYLDSVGVVASFANRLLLKQSAPDLKQILFWDTFLVPLSKIMDRLTSHTVGKSILGIWRKL
jgi:hypothetical protein